METLNPLPELWTHVVRNKKKGNKKQQQQNISFNPTLITPPVSTAAASPSESNATSAPSPIAMVRPFMKGVEEDSVFIDLATVKDRTLLDRALVKFNEEAEKTDIYEEFLGYRKQTRQYLGHHFLETLWLPNADGRKTLIESGITLADETYLKGFPSYSAEATIVRITMENLPFLLAVQLKKEMAERFSCFGDVLDHGIFKTENGIFQGEGYVTLNLTLSNTPDNDCMEPHEMGFECSGKRHLEPLKRVIIWDTNSKEDDQRQILLQWDQMPAFCRQCQKPDHCRADCPDYHKWAICYHCNKRGHVSKNCDRNNAESAPAKVRIVEKPPTRPKERKAAKITPSSNKGNESERRGTKNVEKDSTMIEVAPPKPSSVTPDSQHHQAQTAEDTVMEEDTTNIGMSDAHALKTVSRDMNTSRSQFDPTTAAKKLIRRDGSADISEARYQGSDNTSSRNEALRIPGNDTDKMDRNLNPPVQGGTQPSNNL